nr:RNA-directed DNA polymerase, eukaryota [Tanacetum cinerariifolium]
MWVWGQGHMGRSGEGLGTVQVRWGCTGMAGEGVVVLAGKGVGEVVDADMFHGIDVCGSVNLSHMFYADDAVFIGEWSESNISSLIHVLDCFHKVSGLKIKMSKSKIMGIEVDNGKVSRAAIKLGCLVLKTPFLYLGSYVGGDMNKLHNWKDIVDKVRRRLSRWKMKILSLGGRLTLIKSVLGVYAYLSHVNVQNPRRFLAQKPTLWSRVIKAIHGTDGSIDGNSVKGANTCWTNIIKEVKVLEEKGINLLSFMKKTLGNGLSTLLWNDCWCDGGKFKDRFPRVYALENCKQITVGQKLAHSSLYHSFLRIPRGGLEQSQFEALASVVHPVKHD